MKIGEVLAGREERVVCLKPLYLDFDGTRMSPIFTIKNWRDSINYQPRPDDVFIATFPKCGTTWMQEITYLMLNDGKPPANHLERLKNNPFIEITGVDGPHHMKRPGCIKTHLPRNLVPYAEHAKYIHVLRNPKDCVVSYFHHHTKSFTGYDYADGQFEHFFELFMAGETEFNDYFTHLLSWYPQSKQKNTLVVHYEDLKNDARAEILRVAKFMDNNIYNKLLTTDLLDKVVQGSSFDTMKADYENFEIPLENIDNLNAGLKNFVMTNIALKTADGSAIRIPGMVREGRVGGWGELLTPQMEQRLERKIVEVLQPACPEIVEKWRQYGVMSS